ncbi:transglutaminase-like domain-containing protein [Neotamlana laminarinivorans]|uniref:Transglutaminase-like domain-containing protein n=1 Tax=Neotamlana laminarinivorans TaxID=2883124 RepID=A0A9X1HZ43_9FLAO|nr:transglutaminase-like domain-containing protein [Tamlana laminarinivorans]MCB4797613.1 transglutaminase-like domain-containing protein [Tamlana laminarinivorans]
MKKLYTITYSYTKKFKQPVTSATWLFLVTPTNNNSQKLISSNYRTNIPAIIDEQNNNFNYRIITVKPKKMIGFIKFDSKFIVEVNFVKSLKNSFLNKLKLFFNSSKAITKVIKNTYDVYLNPGSSINYNSATFFVFNNKLSIFKNLKVLMKYVNQSKQLENKLDKFCYFSKLNQVPTRFVSGYLMSRKHISQWHNWVECYIYNIGWIGFDIINNCLINYQYIKVADGINETDCIAAIFYNLPDEKLNQYSQQQQ